MAKLKGMDIAIEAEIGLIGSMQSETVKTDIEDARFLCGEVGCDMLAPSVGNVHGLSTKSARLDFDLLRALHSELGLPIVLHGSSGTVEKDLELAVDLGVTKVNFETEYRRIFQKTLMETLVLPPKIMKPREVLGVLRKKYLTGRRKSAVFYVAVTRQTCFGTMPNRAPAFRQCTARFNERWSKPMNICMIPSADIAYESGSTIYAADLCSALADAGHCVHVVCKTFPNRTSEKVFPHLIEALLPHPVIDDYPISDQEIRNSIYALAEKIEEIHHSGTGHWISFMPIMER